MGKCFAVVSGKGGTGKSTVSCGLAVSFSRKGNSVLVIDLDKGLRCIDSYFGIDPDVVLDLSDAFTGNDISDVFYKINNENELYVIPSPPADFNINSDDFSVFLEKCGSRFDVIILDLPAGLDFSLIKNVPAIKYICVSNQDPVSIKDAAAVRNALNGISPLLILNKFDVELLGKRKYDNIDGMIDNSGIQLVGIIPDTKDMKMFPITNKFKKRGRIIKALNRITERLAGKSVKLPRPDNI